MKCAKFINILASPGDVFEEVVTSPPNLANWRIPTLLVCLVSIVFLQLGDSPAQFSSTIRHVTEFRTISVVQAQALAGLWPILSASLVCIAIFAGTCWSAFVLWFIGRIFLKVRFPYIKALEIVGLTGAISVLGSITTLLLIAAAGDPAAQPALSLMASKLDHNRPLYQILSIFNFFHLWITIVLAIGLSRLCNVTFKEGAFWVFGYWVAVRIIVIILQ